MRSPGRVAAAPLVRGWGGIALREVLVTPPIRSILFGADPVLSNLDTILDNHDTVLIDHGTVLVDHVTVLIDPGAYGPRGVPGGLRVLCFLDGLRTLC